MTQQHYIGCKQVEAWEQEGTEYAAGTPGYAVKYQDGYTSWSPKDVFEAAYLPMGTLGADMVNADRVTEDMVRDFIRAYHVTTIGEKTTVVQATLRNGFEIVESSSCVDPANYREEVGAEICRDRIRKQVWHLLGFALQWARSGLSTVAEKADQ